MTTHDVSIEHDGRHGSVVVDGQDLGRACRSVTWSAEAGDHPQMVLELLVHDVTKIGSKSTEVLIPEATAEALVTLGWTPPATTERPGDGHSAPANP